MRQNDGNGNDIMKGKETGKCNFQQRNINAHFLYGR